MDCSITNSAIKTSKISEEGKIKKSKTYKNKQIGKKSKLIEEKFSLQKKKKLTLNNASELPSQNLLLSYTYFLDEFCTTYISIGYDCNTLNPVFCIKKSGIMSQIKLTPSEWTIFFLSIKENNQYDVSIKINTNCTFLVKKCDKIIEIKYKNFKIYTNLDAYNKLLNLSEFFNDVILHYNNCTNLISKYYKTIVSECLRKNLEILTRDDFFILNENTHLFINYNRLYNELLTLCETKIRKDIFFEQTFIDLKDCSK